MELTRRKFVTNTSVGLVAGVIAGKMIESLPGFTPTPAASNAGPLLPGEPLIAHITNLATGEISLLVGTREVVYRDPVMANRLMAAARS
jgi:hypothetical protein